jgi:hypothetical protein
MHYSDWRQKLLYNTSQARQLMTRFVRRYRAGRPVTYQDEAPIQEAPSEFVSFEPEIYEGQMPDPLEYEPVNYNFSTEAHTPDLRLEPPQFELPEPSPLEEEIISAQQEIQDAIDEIKEPENLEDLLRNNLFPPLF